MNKKIKHLYIHIPFCKSICTYCDFVRLIENDNIKIEKYINYLICKISKFNNHQFKTIYIGGGTPNSLSNNLLLKLLSLCKNKLSKNYEFTIECNPEFINEQQANTFSKCGINRVSLGVQSVNDKINKLFNRKHNIFDVINSIKILKKYKITNISCDFIYGFNQMNQNDIITNIKFIKKFKIPHCSFYSLEIQNNSILSKTSYKQNDELIDKQLLLIINKMNKNKYQRYEVSNWCIDKKYQSKHNLAYWQTKEWIGLGLGAYGFEKMNYYHYEGNINSLKKINQKYKQKEYYFQILMMGLRLIQGINLKNKDNLKAYNFFKNKIDKKQIIIKNNYLRVKNIDKLDNILIELV